MGSLASALSPLAPEQEKRRLFAALAQLFLHQATKHPVLLIVEDLRWSDQTSLDFLHYLARSCAVSSLLVLLTYRSDEVHPSLSHFLMRVDDVLEVSAPRGTFTFRQGKSSIILLSAGVGASPMLAMLHALAAVASPREVWWLFGARRRDDHPFAQEARLLLQALPKSRSYIFYSRPGQEDRSGLDFDAPGYLNGWCSKSLTCHARRTSICVGQPRSCKI